MNDSIAVVVLTMVAVAPMPLGSNRPMFWMMSATVVFLAVAVFIANAARINRAFPVPIRRVWLLAALAFSYLAFVALQSRGGQLSVAPHASILAALRTLSYMAFFFLVLQVSANSKRATWMIVALLCVVAFYALIGFLARFGVVKLPEVLFPNMPQANATATFVNRNSFATYLGFGLLIGVALITRQIQSLRTHSQRVAMVLTNPHLLLYGAMILVVLVTLVSTNSRMGGAAVFFALGSYLFVVAIKRSHINMRSVLVGSVFLASAMVAAIYQYGAVFLGRLGAVEHDADIRMALYQQVWGMIKARPWAGFGADSFELAFQKFHRLPVNPDLVWDKAHNSYLTNWAETGLVFGSVPILILALVFAMFIQAVVKRQQNYILPLLGIAVILQSAMHSLVDFSLEIQANTYMLLAIIAIALADTLGAGGKSEDA